MSATVRELKVSRLTVVDEGDNTRTGTATLSAHVLPKSARVDGREDMPVDFTLAEGRGVRLMHFPAGFKADLAKVQREGWTVREKQVREGVRVAMAQPSRPGYVSVWLERLPNTQAVAV